jgi:uncharacterized protein
MTATSSTQLANILAELRGDLVQVLGDQLDTVLLFGSHARGEAGPASDLDVLIVLRGEFSYSDMLRRTSTVIATLSLDHDVVISRAFVSRKRFETEQSPFLMNVRAEGMPI